jgi:hypothetical protein
LTGVFTVTSTTPVPGGLLARIDVSLRTTYEAGLAVPKFTAPVGGVPVNPVPVIVTVVPPEVGPDVGEMLVTAGAVWNVYWSVAGLAELVPTGVVTVTSTGPSACAGVTVVIEVSLLTIKFEAFVAPYLTLVAPVKPVPVTVTFWPPALVPL